MIINAPKAGDIPALRALFKQAFDDTDAWLDGFFTTAFSPSRCRAVWENGKPLAALYWFDFSEGDKKIAYLYAIATDEAERGKGLCTSLMKDTHEHLSRLGYAFAVLVPAKESLFAFYGKMGYTPFSPIRYITARAEKGACALRSLSVEEYARLRRALLPEGGIIEENACLDLLAMDHGLYAVKNTVLAARKEGDSLFATELLGDSSLCPAILHALSCQEGTFRTSGGDTPFAMYHPLSESAGDPPRYFGLSLG